MISTYKEEITKLYEIVEKVATAGSDLHEIGMTLKPGDFYLVGDAANGLLFTFEGLVWEKNGIEYDALL